MERYCYTLEEYKRGVIEAIKKVSTTDIKTIVDSLAGESMDVINMMDFIEQEPMNHLQIAWRTPIRIAYLRQYFGADMRGGRFSDKLKKEKELEDCTLAFSISAQAFSAMEDVFKWCDNRNAPDKCLTIGIFIMAANIYAALKDQIAYMGPVTITYISAENNDPNGYITENSILRVRIIRFDNLNEMMPWLEFYAKHFGLIIDFAKPGPIKIMNEG